MIFPASLVLPAAEFDHGPNLPFVKTGSDLKSSSYIREDSSLDLPEIMRIAHTNSTIKGVVTDRHLLQFSLKKRSPATGAEGTCVVNLTISLPRNGVIDSEDVLHLTSHIYNMIGTADTTVTPSEAQTYIRALLRNQV